MALPFLRLGGCPRGGPQHVGGRGSVASGNGPRGLVVAGTERTTRSRFSVSVPVLSKHTVSTRPSASMVRGARTSTPRADSRWAAASWDEGGHQRQALRDGGHRNGDAVGDRLTQRRAAQQRQTRHRGTAGERQRKDLAGQLAQPGLHPGRRLDVDDRRNRAVRGGAHTGGDHDRPGMPRDDRAALEQHAGPVGVGGGDRIHLFVDRQRLTGEQRFVDLEVLGHQQTRIGGHHVGSGQVDDVAGTQ